MNPKIMVVDDEREVCDVISSYFGKRGYEVIVATSGEEALAKLSSEKPTLILLDIYMPQMDGIECLQHIKEMNKQTPVIMVTCANDTEIAKNAMRLGAVDYLVKPLFFNAIETAVMTHLFLNNN